MLSIQLGQRYAQKFTLPVNKLILVTNLRPVLSAQNQIFTLWASSNQVTQQISLGNAISWLSVWGSKV